jgi:hypothetical protein
MNVIFNFFDCKGERKAPPRPHKPSLAEKVQMENSVADFGIKLSLPVPGASDVATRLLTVTVNGGDPPILQTLLGSALVSDQLVLHDNDTVVATLVDVDGHNNHSPASAAFSFTVIDDVAPPAPGALGIAEKVQLN